MNDDEFANAIDAGLRSLEARPVKPRGRRAILTAHVERMKQAIERGYTVGEIVAELKMHGAHVSRALINQILKPAAAEYQNKTRKAAPPAKGQVGRTPTASAAPKMPQVPPLQSPSPTAMKTAPQMPTPPVSADGPSTSWNTGSALHAEAAA